MRFLSKLLWLFLLLAWGVAAGETPSASGNDIESRKNELEEIKREIDRNRNEISKLTNKETDLATKLRKIDDNISMVNRYVRTLNDQETALEDDMDSIKMDLGRATAGLARRKTLLSGRIRRIYIQGRYDPIEVFFSSHSFSDYIRRETLFRYLADNDHRLITAVVDQQRVIRKSKDKLADRINEVQAIIAEKNSEQNKLADERKTREKLLRNIQGRKDLVLKLTEDLEKRKQEINKIIEALEEARRKAYESTRKDRLADYGDFGKLKGRLSWPVEGKVIRRFGKNVHPVYKTKTINNGVDIETQVGAAIQAVASGEVLYTGTMSSFGNFLILGHSSGFYTLYANLGAIRVKKGEKVGAGQQIGTSGEAEGLEGPKLHFEVRQERRIFDPLDWLKRRG